MTAERFSETYNAARWADAAAEPSRAQTTAPAVDPQTERLLADIDGMDTFSRPLSAFSDEQLTRAKRQIERELGRRKER